MKQYSVAIIYDRLTTAHGGAEFVLAVMLKAFPDAHLFTSVHEREKSTALHHDVSNIHTTWMQQLPPFIRSSEVSNIVRPLAFESLNLDQYEIVISVSSGEAKGVLTKPQQTHLTYLLTPPRYIYSHRDGYLNSHAKIPGLKLLAKKYLQYLRTWDQAASWRSDTLIPISERVATRARRYYPERNIAQPIYPPHKQLKKSTMSLAISNFLLFVGRLVWYKQADICLQLAQDEKQPIIIVGTGKQQQELHAAAPDQTYIQQPQQSVAAAVAAAQQQKKLVVFIQYCKDVELAALYQHAQALLMPGEDDFGITALEALEFGLPVIINTFSGAAEIVAHQQHGIHIESSAQTHLTTLQALKHAYRQYKAHTFSEKKLQKHAHAYSTQQFIGQIRKTVYDTHMKGSYVST